MLMNDDLMQQWLKTITKQMCVSCRDHKLCNTVLYALTYIHTVVLALVSLWLVYYGTKSWPKTYSHTIDVCLHSYWVNPTSPITTIYGETSKHKFM